MRSRVAYERGTGRIQRLGGMYERGVESEVWVKRWCERKVELARV